MDTSEKISVNLIVADVVQQNGDTAFKDKSRGYYVGRIQAGLEKLAITTYYDDVTLDLFDWKAGWVNAGKYNLLLPPNCFDLKKIYLFKGQCQCNKKGCNDCRKVFGGDFVKVNYKVNYNRFGGSDRATADITEDSWRDPELQRGRQIPYRLYYGNVQNGVLALSENSEHYENVRLIYKGFGGTIGNEPVIPREFREALIDFTLEQFYAWKKSTDRNYRTDWMDINNKLNSADPINPGSWLIAKRVAIRLQSWKRDAINNYQSNYEF